MPSRSKLPDLVRYFERHRTFLPVAAFDRSQAHNACTDPEYGRYRAARAEADTGGAVPTAVPPPGAER